MLQLPQSDMSIKSDHVVNSVCTKTLPPTSATSRRRTSPGNKAVDVGLRTHAVSTRLENRQFLTCTTILHQSGKDEGQRHATWSLPEIDTAVIPARLPSLGELTITMDLVLPPHGWTKTRRLRGMQCTTILDQSGKDEGQRHATWSLPENDAAMTPARLLKLPKLYTNNFQIRLVGPSRENSSQSSISGSDAATAVAAPPVSEWMTRWM